MRFEAWEPVYLAILKDFDFTREKDEEAANLLSQLLRDSEHCLSDATMLIGNHHVAICGNAPSLMRDLEIIEDQNLAFVAADGAVEVLLEKNIVPDIIVTDLDGPFESILEANEKGSIVVVHAHGDNLDALRQYVPQLKRVIGTAQCRPSKGLYNFGGFTDGDRCVFLARHLGAASLRLLGFDFEDPSVTPRKRKKLSWARRLIDLAFSKDFSISQR